MTTLTEGKHAGGFLTWEVLRDYAQRYATASQPSRSFCSCLPCAAPASALVDWRNA